MLEAYERDTETQATDGRRAAILGIQAEISMAERRFDDAVRDMNEARDMLAGCQLCYLTEIGRAHAEAGRYDSAAVAFEQYLDLPSLYRVQTDAFIVWGAFIGLGAAHEALGNSAAALDAYGRFLEAWGDADPDLQGLVDDIRARVARIVAEGSG